MENQNCKIVTATWVFKKYFLKIISFVYRKAETWPEKLIMQLMPKNLIGSIGGAHLKDSKSVVFQPTPCEALESLTKYMTSGYVSFWIPIPYPNSIFKN